MRPRRRQPIRLPRPWDSPGKNTGVGCHFLLQFMKVKSESEVAQSCLTLRNPMDCSLPGSSIYGIFQAKVLEWDAIAFSILDHMVVLFLVSRELSYWSSEWLYQFTFQPTIQEGSLFFTPSPTLIVCRLFDDGHCDLFFCFFVGFFCHLM